MIIIIKKIVNNINLKYTLDIICIFCIIYICFGCGEKSTYLTQLRPNDFDAKENQTHVLHYNKLINEYNLSQSLQSILERSVDNLDDTVVQKADWIRIYTILQIIFTVIPITLALIHLLLFLLNIEARDNLFHSLFMISFAILAFSQFEMYFDNKFRDLLFSVNLENVFINLALLFGLLIIYWRQQRSIPNRFYIFLTGSIIFGALILFWLDPIFHVLFYVFLTVVAIEIIRIISVTVRESEDKNWISITGFIILMLAIVYQLLLNHDILDLIGDFSIVYVYGILVFGITLSIDLIRDFAHSNIRLSTEEREIREKEIKRRVMEADYSRKTEELEEARRLQVGMLPREVPQLPHLDIAVYMKTATEVGGDYYDFNETTDGTLTIAIGDATGHGIKAGVMVALIKSLFNMMAHTFFIPDFFTHCTKMIRKMNFYNLYMCLMLVRINKHQLNVSAAGMPPLLIYRKENKQVEDIVIKGLPLGGPVNAKYEQKQTLLKTGDVILMMTDGYMDLFNPAKEILDLERVKDIFLENGTTKPDDIIKALIKEGERWRGNQPQDDDITFVVIKVKN